VSQQPQDDKGLARQALGSAVASYGISVLSEPQALREALTRLLPNSPLERSLLSAAAGADVASRLRRHIQEGYEDAGRAVQAVARELAERTAIEIGACLWVTGEFARVLGYPESSAITLAYPTQQLAEDQLPPVQPEPQPWGAPQPGFGGYQEQVAYGAAGAGITAGSQQPMMQPPGVQPPGVQPPGVQPPRVQPPRVQPPGVQPPGVQPPGVQPPGVQPPGVQPPGVQPPGVQPPGVQPSGVQPPGMQPPGVEPAWGQVPGTQPPGIQPGVQQPGVQPGGWWQMPPGQVPPGPGAPVPGYGPPRRPGNRGRVILIVAAAVVVALGGYAGAAAATHLFPFHRVEAAPLPRPSIRPTHHQPTATPTPSPTSSVATLPSGKAPLTALLPGVLDDPASQCSPILPPYHWTMSGVVQALQCDQVPGLRDGTVFAFQLDSASNYLTAWGNYNQWWGFNGAAAGTSCPPGSATSEGTVSWSGHFFPQHEGQVLECEEVSGNQPAYTWTMPTEYAFIVAQGAPGSSFAALQTWWTDDAGPNTAPSPATP
jgi:hypothetical protein